MFYANYMRERMKVPKYAEAEGNPITIADSLERPIRDMRILGESVQDGTSGNNLITSNVFDVQGRPYWYSTRTISSRVAMSTLLPVSPSTQYTFTISDNCPYKFGVQQYETEADTTYLKDSGWITKKSYTVVTDSATRYIWLCLSTQDDSETTPEIAQTYNYTFVVSHTPTPEAPIDVVSVENPIVTVTGKNLFDIDNVKVAFTNEWSKSYSPKIENGVLYSGGVASQTSGGHCYVYCGKKPCTISLTITFVDAPGTDYGQTYYEYINVVQFDDVTEKGYWINMDHLISVRQIKNNRYNITIYPTKDYVGFAVTHRTTKYAIKVTDIQIELGETATEYEPYKEEQKVSLDGITLRGLKDSKGNFVARDEIVLDGVKNTVELSTNVLEWVMDGVSAGRGHLYVNAYTSAMYGVSNFKASIPKPIRAYIGFSNYFKNCKVHYTNAVDTYTFNGDNFYIDCSSISEVGKNDQAQAWFKERFEEGNPAIFYFAMTEPIKTDITNTEAGQKLLELYTNRGTTNISLNSESDLGEIWVRYVRK